MRLRNSLSIFKKPWVLLLLLLSFHAVNNYIILSLDNTIPTYDEWGNFEEAFYIHAFFKNLNLKIFSLNEIYNFYLNLGDRNRPPLYKLTLSPLFFFTKNIDADYMTIVVNILYFAILLFSIYGIGVKLFNNLTGILSAFILSIFPGIFAMSRVLMVDFPLTAMVSLSVYLMLSTNYFTDTKYSSLFGLSVGLGMLTKVPFIIFISPLLIYYVFISFIKSPKGDRQTIRIIRNLIVSSLVAILITGSWYFPNLHNVIQRAKAMSFQLHNSPPGSFIDYYIKLLFSYHIGPLFFILGFVSIFECLRKENFLLLLWLWVPLLIFSFSPNKNPRFILPLLPSIALMIGCSVSCLSNYLRTKIISLFIIIFGLVSYFTILQGKVGSHLKNEMKSFPLYSPVRVHYGILFPYQDIDWKEDKIGNVILSNLRKEIKSISMLYIFNLGEIHNGLDYYLLRKGIEVRADCPAEADFFDEPLHDSFSNSDISSFDFVMMKDGNVGENAGKFNWIEKLTDVFGRSKDKFSLVGSISGLPDGSTVYIFKNKCLEN